MFDIGWVGGLSEASAIAALAESYELPIAPHDCTGPVVLTASSHLVTSAPNALVQETVRAYYTSWYGDVVTTLPPSPMGRSPRRPAPAWAPGCARTCWPGPIPGSARPRPPI